MVKPCPWGVSRFSETYAVRQSAYDETRKVKIHVKSIGAKIDHVHDTTSFQVFMIYSLYDPQPGQTLRLSLHGDR